MRLAKLVLAGIATFSLLDRASAKRFWRPESCGNGNGAWRRSRPGLCARARAYSYLPFRAFHLLLLLSTQLLVVLPALYDRHGKLCALPALFPLSPSGL